MAIDIGIKDNGLGTGDGMSVSKDGSAYVTDMPRNLKCWESDQIFRVKFFNDQFTNASGSANLNVNGAVTPQQFLIRPPAGELISVRELRFAFEGADLDMGTNDVRRFGAAAGTGGLTNGLTCFIEQKGMTQGIFINPIQHMSQYFHYITDFYNVPDGIAVNEDLLVWVIDLKLLVPIPVIAGGTDRVVVQVNDDLTALNFFQVFATGQREPL